MEENQILQVNNLNVSYKKNAGKIKENSGREQILKGVSFGIRKGEILGLVGESGCGKSTLAKAVLDMVKIDSGEILHASKRPQMVFQDPYSSLNPVKKIGWILEEPLRLSGGYSKEQRREKVREMLCTVGLDEEYAERYPSQLSGGQRQRVAIAGALMLAPKLIIADEPVSALDVTIQAQIIELLLRLHQEMDLSMLFISHDLRVVYQLCDRIIIMHEGQIVEEGEPEQVYFSPKHAYTKQLLEAAGIGQG